MSATITEPIAQTGTPGQQGGEGQGSAPPAQQQGGNEDRTFSQQAVNALIGSRLKEARAQWEQAAKDATETAEAEKRGEYEKVIAKERERADAEKKRADDVEDAARRRILQSEIRSVAVELRFANPSVAYRLIDATQVEFDEAGEPKNVKALLEKLAKDEPYLVASDQQGGNAAIPRTPNGTTMTQEQFREQERQKALRSGKYSAL